MLYANQVYFGHRDSFSIYGIGEAASVYFNKDVSALTLPEAAFLTGLIRGPNLYLPYEHPKRAAERRNFVLGLMQKAGFISASDAEQASRTPLGLTEQSAEARQQAYFVDMVKTQLLARFSERDLLSRGYRIYTTLDLDLQRAASEGARAGLTEVDRQVKKQKERKKTSPLDSNQPQLALVALDPHTGDVKALIGGRGYGASQLNHVLARRQPGSSFKPFVYATALNSGVDGSQPLITLATVLADEPTTFEFGNKPYAPENYKQAYHGSVTVREALTYSLNVPAVHLAEMVGYGKVRDFAMAVGFNNQLEPTPAIALGAYVATPLEVAGAYTIFANRGEYVAPRCIVAVADAGGRTVWDNHVSAHRVLDSRVSYLMVSLLESVINSGTGAGVRAGGFGLPAAGKTGTSHDGWFAGFTSNLLAVVWVGYDDDRDLDITGAHSALPLWTEFMKRTTGLPVYKTPQPFSQPDGIENGRDRQSHQPCSARRSSFDSQRGLHCGYGAIPPSSGRTDRHSYGAAEPTRDYPWGEGITSAGGRNRPDPPLASLISGPVRGRAWPAAGRRRSLRSGWIVRGCPGQSLVDVLHQTSLEVLDGWR